MTTKEIHGILAYPVTPFTEDNAVDTGKLATLVERLVADGAHGIVPLGSTGSPPISPKRSSTPSSTPPSESSTVVSPSSSAPRT